MAIKKWLTKILGLDNCHRCFGSGVINSKFYQMETCSWHPYTHKCHICKGTGKRKLKNGW